MPGKIVHAMDLIKILPNSEFPPKICLHPPPLSVSWGRHRTGAFKIRYRFLVVLVIALIAVVIVGSTQHGLVLYRTFQNKLIWHKTMCCFICYRVGTKCGGCCHVLECFVSKIRWLDKKAQQNLFALRTIFPMAAMYRVRTSTVATTLQIV